MTEKKTNDLNAEIIEKAFQEAEKHKDVIYYAEFDTVPRPGTKELNEADNGVFDYDTMQESVEKLSENYNVQAWRPLSSGIPVLRFIILFFKKMIRKMIKFYIEPIVLDQAEVNRHTAIVSNEIANYVDVQDKAIQNYETRIHGLESQIYELNKKNQLLEDELNSLKQVIEKKMNDQ